MNNFTKSYIREADCREIQGLRSVFEAHDWYCQPSCFNIPYTLSHGAMIDKEVRGKDYIWLPTGDQLDEEIVKICKKKQWDYRADYNYSKNEFSIYIKQLWWNYREDNPLIAKIRLLKQLIKEH